jgi:hypothetical protein
VLWLDSFIRGVYPELDPSSLFAPQDDKCEGLFQNDKKTKAHLKRPTLPDGAQLLSQRLEVYYVFLVIFQQRSQGPFVATLHVAPP